MAYKSSGSGVHGIYGGKGSTCPGKVNTFNSSRTTGYKGVKGSMKTGQGPGNK